MTTHTFKVVTMAMLLAVDAPAQSLQSGPGQVALLELFTSQGCSSCPPADRWLSSLKQDPRLWRQLVPVAFHVDYWDRLGWKDPHARPQYSQRQRSLSHAGVVKGVYTPGFVVAGREWRAWFSRPELDAASDASPGVLRLELGDGGAKGQFVPSGRPAAEYTLHVARLGFDLETPVPAGENSGRTLQEDFVVLDWQSSPLHQQAGSWVAAIDLRWPGAAAGRQAVAAWVSTAGDPRPIQALGGWLE